MLRKENALVPLCFDGWGAFLESKESDSDMGDKDETRTPFKVPKPYLRNGSPIWQFRQRIPSDLVKAGVYGKLKDRKRSLRTSDKAKAERLAITVALQWSEEWDAKRDELARQGIAGFLQRRNSEEQVMRRLSSLDQRERQDMILRYFVRLEKRERDGRHRDLERLEEDELHTILETVGEDLAVYEGTSKSHASFDWDKNMSALFEGFGVTEDGRDSEAYLEMRDLLKRATVENVWRTYRALQGHPQETRDAFFRELGAESDIESRPWAREVSIGELCESFIESKRKADKAPKTISRYVRSGEVLAEFFGADRKLSTITPEDAEEFILLLKDMPVMTKKAFRGKTIREAIALANRSGNEPRASAKRICDLYDDAKSMLHFAIGRRWIDFSPFAGRHLLDQLPRVKKRVRKQFSEEELSRLFSSRMFLDQREGQHCGDPPRGGKYWVPLICLFQGFRQDEACSVRLEDLDEDLEVPTIWIRELEENGKRVIRTKNDKTNRKVPLHPTLIDLGFLAFIRARRERGQIGRLFPEFKANKDGKFNGAMSKWFPRLVEDVLELEDREPGEKTFHTLRHTFTDALRAAEIPSDIRAFLGGRADGRADEV